MSEVLKRSWVEINLSQIQRNYEIYKRSMPSDASIMAVVKADAYGHGDVAVATSLQKMGVTHWAVSNMEEACRLRKAGVAGEILILGYTPIDQLDILERYDIAQTLISEGYAEAVAAAQGKMKCQFAIDTGMNRIGLDAKKPTDCINTIRKYADKLNLNGLFTHLCVADSDNEIHLRFTDGQISRFEVVADGLADLGLKNIHCLNSAGGLWHKTKYDSLVRLGIMLYGLKPDSRNVLPNGILPSLTWKSVVSMVKVVKKDESIGYGCSYIANKDIVVATISTGYADGYNRMLSNKGHVVINGDRAPIVGRICMDQFMVDVTDIPDVKMGDEVFLLTDSYTADDMAHEIGTIGYEVICNISKRVPRVYIRK